MKNDRIHFIYYYILLFYHYFFGPASLFRRSGNDGFWRCLPRSRFLIFVPLRLRQFPHLRRVSKDGGRSSFSSFTSRLPRSGFRKRSNTFKRRAQVPCITTTRHGKSRGIELVFVLVGCVGFGCVRIGCVGFDCVRVGCVGFGCVEVGFFGISGSRKVLPIRNAARQKFVFLENVQVEWRNSSAFKPGHNILMRYGKWQCLSHDSGNVYRHCPTRIRRHPVIALCVYTFL